MACAWWAIMPCMKRTSASVKMAPLGMVTGADMAAIDCWATAADDLSAALPDEQPTRSEERSSGNTSLRDMREGTVFAWEVGAGTPECRDQADTIQVGQWARHHSTSWPAPRSASARRRPGITRRCAKQRSH